MPLKAVELAKKDGLVLLYIGLDEISESEDLDRARMELPQSQVDLIEAVSATNPNVVAIMSAGSAVEMPWLDKCKALIHGYLCGQAGASSVLRVVMGQVNPSGKLAESYPIKYEDVSSAPYFPAKERIAEYREGLYVGSRHFETANAPVLFPFGFGLSYTTFQYSDLTVTDKEAMFSIKITMPTVLRSAQIGMKECRQTVAFLVELVLRGGKLQRTWSGVADYFQSSKQYKNQC